MSRVEYRSMEAFGSPMLGSTITTAPRRQGDGMDSETLLRHTADPDNRPAKLPPRHTNLNSTSGSQVVDVERGQKGKFIPHEPVKGAVRPVPPPTNSTQPDTGSTCKSEREVTHQEGHREVEGHSESAVEIQQLSVEVEDLKQQMHLQYKVNADLKKLLVASVGDDLHHKVDSLVRTRAQLASEIGGYTDKIYEDHESLDKLAIQADMWYSKFMASRVVVDQLAESQETLTMRWKVAERALHQFVQEREQLYDSLIHTHRYLKCLKDSFSPLDATRTPVTIPNIMELARTNHLLADSIKFRLIPAMPVFPAALDAGIQDGPTPAEKLALQALNYDNKLDFCAVDQPVPYRLSSKMLHSHSRFQLSTRYDKITFNCCPKCRGDVQVV